MTNTNNGKKILAEAMDARAALADFRKNRDRCIDYTFGRQWNDLITFENRVMTEQQYLMSEGAVPLQNNLIRRIVRNVLGVFRKSYKDMAPEEGKDKYWEELFSRTMEEFLISGMAIHRKRVKKLNHCEVMKTDIVSPTDFFFNMGKDFRGSDISLVGQLHELDFRIWCKEFVKSRTDYEKALVDFPEGKGRIKVAEIWRRENRPRCLLHDRNSGCIRILEEDSPLLNSVFRKSARKWFMDDVWRYYFVTEDGQILREGDSPFFEKGEAGEIRGRHPFVFRCYPYLDGEIRSFVSDIIDQQRYTNRLITLYDWIIRTSAKGVLMLPAGSIEPHEMEGVVRQWSRFNGVIVYKPNAYGCEPHQITGNLSNIGISELLNIQFKMMEDISGVNSALQGKLAGNSISGTLYNQQTENAMASLNDLLETFATFMRASVSFSQSG